VPCVFKPPSWHVYPSMLVGDIHPLLGSFIEHCAFA
jgi:hypothetical protein